MKHLMRSIGDQLLAGAESLHYSDVELGALRKKSLSVSISMIKDWYRKVI